MTRLLWCLLLVGAGLAAVPPTQPLPTASPYLTNCHSERNEMKPRLNVRLDEQFGQGRAGKESQSLKYFYRTIMFVEIRFSFCFSLLNLLEIIC